MKVGVLSVKKRCCKCVKGVGNKKGGGKKFGGWGVFGWVWKVVVGWVV